MGSDEVLMELGGGLEGAMDWRFSFADCNGPVHGLSEAEPVRIWES